jgi:hypothetical protein
MVGFRWNQDVNLDAAVGGVLQRQDEAGAGHEVRRANLDRSPRQRQGREIDVREDRALLIGAARNDLDDGGASATVPPQVFERRQVLLRCVEPVLDEDLLQLAHGGAFEAQVRIFPWSDTAQPPAVLVPDVLAAREAYFGIDDDDLAMVPAVDVPR